MNILSRDRQIEIISALTEGMSIRAVERITGVHRDTIMRLGIGAGLLATCWMRLLRSPPLTRLRRPRIGGVGSG
jgi:hypothetical protein